MTVYDLSKNSQFNVLTMPEPEREINGVYIGDLLSWVMGKAQYDNVWITIMSNINVIAVASLSDVSCVLLAEDVTLDNEVLSTAKQKGINILSTPMSAYDAAIELSGMI
ncbi:MAG: hypothetical protein IKL46_02465 [Clostridia bacterium]|nr:hypothetical protein [Clostridia bacterium]MBR3591695.1 hypothetical protein [Clostridia bacterium]